MTDYLVIDNSQVGRYLMVRFDLPIEKGQANETLEQKAAVILDQFKHPILVTADPFDENLMIVLNYVFKDKDRMERVTCLSRANHHDPYEGARIEKFYRKGCKGYELASNALDNRCLADLIVKK